jgi:hypothetical protein
VLEWTIHDRQGNRPSGDFWTEDLTLYLCSGSRLLRDSTATWLYYEPVVKRWGTITEQAYVGEAFATTSDTQIVLYNHRLPAMVDNSEYTFASGAPGETPEATGDEVKLAQLFQFYHAIGSAVELKILFFSQAGRDQNVAANFKTQTIYKGIVENVSMNRDEIVLDITQDRTKLNSSIPGRVLKDSYDQQTKNMRAPIVYGDAWGNITAGELNSIKAWHAVVGGLHRPQVVPAVPFKWDESDGYWWLIYNDTLGRNSGWTSQAALGADGYASINDSLLLFSSPNELWSRVPEATEDNSGVHDIGYMDWYPQGGTGTELTIKGREYIKATAYIPAMAVSSSAGITNPDNAFDGDPNTYATIDLTSTSNYVDLLIRPVKSKPGVINSSTDNAIRGWMIAEEVSFSGSPVVKFGILGAGLNVIPSFYWIGDTDPGDTATGPWGYWGSGYMTGDNDLFDQANANQDYAIDAGDFYLGHTGGYKVPRQDALLNWEWRYNYGIDEEADLVFRAHVKTAGSAGDQLRIIAAGVAVDYQIAKPWWRRVPGIWGI